MVLNLNIYVSNENYFKEVNIMNGNLSHVGERIAKKLDENGMIQADACRITGISKNAMSNYINGKRVPTPEILIKLSNLLDVSIDWLLTGKEKEPKDLPFASGQKLKSSLRRYLEYSMKISEKIKHLRTEELKLSLEEFAEAIEVSVQELEDYESGEKIIPSYIIYRIISAFNVYPQFLLDPDEPVVFEYKVLEDEDEKERLKKKLQHSLAIGKKILQVRMNQQLMDKKEFAQAIDISEEDLEKYESGTMIIPAYVLHRISQEFDINPSYLLDPEEKTMERIEAQEAGDLTEFESGFLHFLKKLPEDEKEEISQILMMKYKKLSKKGRLLTSDNGEDEQAAAKELA